MSPRLSKTEFESESYCGFSIGSFIRKKKEKNGPPASLPAWAGSQAGPFGQHPSLTDGLDRFPGRSPRVGFRPHCRPGPAPRPAHPGAPPISLPPRPHCRPGLVPRPVLSGGLPASPPAHPGAPPALLPAWAGCQAGPMAVSLSLFSPTALFLEPLFKGFLPQINPNLLANLLSYFLQNRFKKWLSPNPYA